MTAVDFVDVVALVAVLEKDGIVQIVGGGRYVRIGPSGSGQSAEVAFLIDDPHQGLGIGSRIFKHLVAIVSITFDFSSDNPNEIVKPIKEFIDNKSASQN